MIEETIHQNYGVDGYCALLMIDVDNFKQINDHYGHLYGDNILSEIGRILQVVFDIKSIAAVLAEMNSWFFWNMCPPINGFIKKLIN